MKRRGGGILELLLFAIVSSFLLYIAFRSCASLVLSGVTRPVDSFFFLPLGFLANCLFVLNLVFWASFEELLYRVYFPNRLEMFFLVSQDRVLSFRSLFVWVLPHLLFGISHSYLGCLNIFFAFCASVFLRTVYIYLKHKIGRVASFALISSLHSFYNICIVYLVLS